MCLSAWLSVTFASYKERAASGQDGAHRVVQMALPDSTRNSFGLAHPHHLERGRLATWQWWHFRWRARMFCLVPCVSCLMEPVSGLVRRTSWLLSRTRTRGRRQEAQTIRSERCDTGRFRDMETSVLEETTHTSHARHKTRDLGLEVEDARLQPHHILTCLRIV